MRSLHTLLTINIQEIKMNIHKLIFVAVLTTILGGCSSTKVEENKLTNNIPSWVLNPAVKDGIAASSCVKYSGNLSIDQKIATANGRLSLAQQIETRVEGLDKTFDNRTDSNSDVTTGSTFSSVSKQLTKQTLTGSRAIKSDILEIAGKQHFCVLTTLSPTVTKELFNAIVKSSKRDINPQDENFLYQEFKAHKAEQSLAEEIHRLTN